MEQQTSKVQQAPSDSNVKATHKNDSLTCELMMMLKRERETDSPVSRKTAQFCSFGVRSRSREALSTKLPA